MSIFDGVQAPVIAVQFSKSGVWTDVPATDVLTIDITRGRSLPWLPFTPGVASVVVNNQTGVYDPEFTATSPWVVGGASILKVGLLCRIVATWSGTGYTLFTGYLETPSANQGIAPTVTFTFADGMSRMGRTLAPVLTVEQTEANAGETTAARAARMLDLAGWPSGAARSLSGSIAMLGDSQDRSALAILQECAAVQAGRFYVTRDNVAKLETLSAKFSKPTMLAFSDDGAANTVKYSGITTTSGADALINDVSIARTGAKTYRASTDASVATYGSKAFTVPAPIQSETAAANLALLNGRQWADAKTRINGLTFDAMRLGNLYPDMLSVELGDLCTVKRNTVDSRTLNFELQIEGIRYAISRKGFAAKLTTSPINPYTITL